MTLAEFVLSVVGLNLAEAIDLDSINETSESAELLARELADRIFARKGDEMVSMHTLDEGGWAMTGGDHVLIVQPPETPGILVLPEEIAERMKAKKKKAKFPPPEDDDEEEEEEDDDEEMEEVTTLTFPSNMIGEFQSVAETLEIGESDADVTMQGDEVTVTLPPHIAQTIADKLGEACVLMTNVVTVGHVDEAGDYEYVDTNNKAGKKPGKKSKKKFSKADMREAVENFLSVMDDVSEDEDDDEAEFLAQVFVETLSSNVSGYLNDPDAFKKAWAAGGTRGTGSKGLNSPVNNIKSQRVRYQDLDTMEAYEGETTTLTFPRGKETELGSVMGQIEPRLLDMDGVIEVTAEGINVLLPVEVAEKLEAAMAVSA